MARQVEVVALLLEVPPHTLCCLVCGLSGGCLRADPIEVEYAHRDGTSCVPSLALLFHSTTLTAC